MCEVAGGVEEQGNMILIPVLHPSLHCRPVLCEAYRRPAGAARSCSNFQTGWFKGEHAIGPLFVSDQALTEFPLADNRQ